MELVKLLLVITSPFIAAFGFIKVCETVDRIADYIKN